MQKTGEIAHTMLHDVSHNKARKRNNEKEREEKQEDSENENLSKALRDKIIKFRECKNKLIKSEQLEENLRTDAERLFVEHDKLQTKSTCVEVRHETLVEKLKDEPYREMFVQKEEDHFEADVNT